VELRFLTISNLRANCHHSGWPFNLMLMCIRNIAQINIKGGTILGRTAYFPCHELVRDSEGQAPCTIAKMLILKTLKIWIELDGPAVSALQRAIVEVKHRWSVIGWVTKNLLSRAPP
jgi:hypothetical protein